ncbi:hypothetical protein JOQ06_029817 [Pogonophryne albipinna]|uniref:Uncharacterized protein n=1 Tax=Pogonophryne albipinna TaxID=1090488 RepID=A0AAD6AYB6_9TELE|nr:hypothetical protein JOQ06_029817 [Pogonophryne albipinna]
MERTFSYRRQEVVQDKPLVADFKSRWPALFEMSEINREFMRITTVPLTSKFLSQLDECSDQLVKVFINKGGVAGKEIRSTIAVMDRSDDIEVRRECILKCLCTYLHEDSGKLVGEYLKYEENEIQQCTNLQAFDDYVYNSAGFDIPECAFKIYELSFTCGSVNDDFVLKAFRKG